MLKKMNVNIQGNVVQFQGATLPMVTINLGVPHEQADCLCIKSD